MVYRAERASEDTDTEVRQNAEVSNDSDFTVPRWHRTAGPAPDCNDNNTTITGQGVPSSATSSSVQAGPDAPLPHGCLRSVEAQEHVVTARGTSDAAESCRGRDCQETIEDAVNRRDCYSRTSSLSAWFILLADEQ